MAKPIKETPMLIGEDATRLIYDTFKEKGLDISISEYSGIMKELNINDLNDLLIKEYIEQ